MQFPPRRFWEVVLGGAWEVPVLNKHRTLVLTQTTWYHPLRACLNSLKSTDDEKWWNVETWLVGSIIGSLRSTPGSRILSYTILLQNVTCLLGMTIKIYPARLLARLKVLTCGKRPPSFWGVSNGTRSDSDSNGSDPFISGSCMPGTLLSTLCSFMCSVLSKPHRLPTDKTIPVLQVRKLRLREVN